MILIKVSHEKFKRRKYTNSITTINYSMQWFVKITVGTKLSRFWKFNTKYKECGYFLIL